MQKEQLQVESEDVAMGSKLTISRRTRTSTMAQPSVTAGLNLPPAPQPVARRRGRVKAATTPGILQASSAGVSNEGSRRTLPASEEPVQGMPASMSTSAKSLLKTTTGQRRIVQSPSEVDTLQQFSAQQLITPQPTGAQEAAMLGLSNEVNLPDQGCCEFRSILKNDRSSSAAASSPRKAQQVAQRRPKNNREVMAALDPEAAERKTAIEALRQRMKAGKEAGKLINAL